MILKSPWIRSISKWLSTVTPSKVRPDGRIQTPQWSASRPSVRATPIASSHRSATKGPQYVSPASNDSVATQPRLPHETRRLSHGPVDCVEVARRPADAVDANFNFG